MPNIGIGEFNTDNFSFMKQPILIYAGHACNEPNLHFPNHKHDDFSELIFICGGEGEFIIDKKPYKAGKGDILVYNRGIFHEEFSKPTDPIDMYYCAIGNLSIKGIDQGCLIPSGIEPVISSLSYASKIEYLISEIFQECCNQNIGYLEICHNQVMTLVITLIRILNMQNQLFVPDKTVTQGSRIKEYIDSNFLKDISLKDMARTLYVSQHYLSHIFKKEIGYSPINYLINKRIDEAKRLLLNTDKTIQEISGLVGYENSNHFNILFKKVTGITPGKYKKDIKGNRINFNN